MKRLIMWAGRGNHNNKHSDAYSETAKPGISVLRVIIFVAHFAAAVFLAVCATRCGGSFITNSFVETLVSSSHFTGYIVQSDASHTCSDPKSRECFFAIPQAYDTAEPGMQWNVFVLLAAFEWISASFALGHLIGNTPLGPNACLLWNLAGALWLMPYTTPMSLLQTGITVLALLVASSVQFYPLGKDEVVMHYTEYCTSASILFVAVLILYVPEPSAWASIVGFACILLCNLTGVCAHMCKFDNKSVECCEQTDLAQPSNNISIVLDMDWSNFRNHFKLYMLQAWLALFTAIFIIIYLAWDSLTSPDVPLWVRFILYNLLVTYNLFGIWATICYVMADSRDFNWWASKGLSTGLSILSAAAKLPIAFTVFYGLIGMPGEGVCSVF